MTLFRWLFDPALGDHLPYVTCFIAVAGAVLMDIGLPKLNGLEAARHIREQPWGKEMHLIALTGRDEEEDRKQSTDAGFNYHLVKPVDHERLLAVLGASLSK